MQRVTQIDVRDTRDFARGAAILGTGGGGDPYIGRLLLDEVLGRTGPAQVLSVDDLDEDALVALVGGMGAPTVAIEKLIGLAEGERALRTLEVRIGRKVTALMSSEIGGMNALYPVALAAHLGLPVVDADGVGRAFPETQMTSLSINGQRLSPLVLCDENGDTVTIDSVDNHRMENLARPVAVPMGGGCAAALCPMTADVVRSKAIRDTLSVAIGIGRSISAARDAHQDPFAALFRYLKTTDYYRHCKLLFEGKIVDVKRETGGGFATGHVKLEGLSGDGQFSLIFRNEFLRAQRDGATVAIVPDLIAVLDRETADPITTERIQYGQRVKVIGMSAAPVMRSVRGLEVCGPKAFGFDEPFLPIESAS